MTDFVRYVHKAIREAFRNNPNTRPARAKVNGANVGVVYSGGDEGGELLDSKVPVVNINDHRVQRRSRIQDGQPVTVGYKDRDPFKPFIISTSRVIVGGEEVPVLLIGFPQWGVLGHDVQGTFDTGDRRPEQWVLPTGDQFEASGFFQWVSARVHANWVVWIAPNGFDFYAFRFAHVLLGHTSDEARKDDPTYLTKDEGNVEEYIKNIEDGPSWLTPSEVIPNHMVIIQPPESEYPSDVGIVVSTYVAAGVVG